MSTNKMLMDVLSTLCLHSRPSDLSIDTWLGAASKMAASGYSQAACSLIHKATAIEYKRRHQAGENDDTCFAAALAMQDAAREAMALPVAPRPNLAAVPVPQEYVLASV